MNNLESDTPEQAELGSSAARRTEVDVGRNEPCPCGSGKNYKKCCLPKDEAAERAKAVADGKAAETALQATLQAVHYFADYLVVHDYFSAADAGRLQSAARRFFDVIRGELDICDPTLRMFPTYAALIDWRGVASPLPAVALATTPMAD